MIIDFMFRAAWFAFLVGAIWGALLGLYFHRPDFLGGYGSFRRRILRLGHISCFGLGIICICFSVCLRNGVEPFFHVEQTARLFFVGLVTMPTVCALTGWKEGFRNLFFIPVFATALGCFSMFLGQ